MGFVLGIVAYLAITFVLNNVILQKEFDIVSSVVQLFAVLITLWIGSKFVKTVTGKKTIPNVSFK